jgi:ppGpp synthetase/RelA/SpoT-type nucleotidyltranferase
MRWVVPEYSRGRVDAAGDLLVSPEEPSEEQIVEAITIINNWRSSHAYPLQALKMTLKLRAKRIDPSALVAQRLKRLSSIARKLLRQDGMKLSRMHDLGGCRAVLSTATQVDRLVKAYERSVAKNPNKRAEFVKKYDYISKPKEDGYRSVHLVYKYRGTLRKHDVFNGLRIEIQIRSRWQHAWATAVETVDLVTGQALKSSIGSPQWKKFFLLMSAAIALREKRQPVPGVPVLKSKLVKEVRRLVAKLKILDVLEGVSAGVHWTTQSKKADSYLLVLNSESKTVQVTGFNASQTTDATEEYLKLETASLKKPEVQAVLVSVDSVQRLRSAYPNFYLDTRAFLKLVRDFIR